MQFLVACYVRFLEAVFVPQAIPFFFFRFAPLGRSRIGNIIKCKAQKSRLTKENSQIETRLYYDRGLDKYYGLLELGEKYGMWKNVAGRYEMNGKKVYAKAILKDPETYFTEEVMQALDEAAAKEFRYGS